MLRVTLFCSVVVGFLFLHLFDAIERKIMYDRSDGLDGGSCFTWDVVMQVNSKTATSCLAMCSGKRCATIFYTPSTHTCMGCYTWYAGTPSLPPSPGSVAYRFNFDCDGGRYNTSCYIWQYPMTWINAKDYCSSISNRFLAVPETYAELSYISSWLKSHTFFVYAYLGVTDKETEGTWKTIHGGVLNYTNWAFLEPNQIVLPQDCLGFNTAAKFADVPCTWGCTVVCEQDMILM